MSASKNATKSDPVSTKKSKKNKIIIIIVAIIVLGGVGWQIYNKYIDTESLKDIKFYSGNGRIEATEINIAAKLAGRITDVVVNEGDFVTRGQILAMMQTNVLEAELAQAKAKHNQAVTAEASAKAMIEVRIAEKDATAANVLQRQSGLDGAKKRFDRLAVLVKSSATSEQQYEDSETLFLSAQAQLASALASVKQAEAAVQSAKANAMGASAGISAAEADIARIQADIDDSKLVSPRDGRIQYRIAEPGEVLSAGGRVLNLVDLTDVYMTFFLPEEIAGKVKIGGEVRLILDAIPNIPIPANVSFVSSVAQFTPKTVETHKERQKLMFRVKARIEPKLLKAYIEYIKTGIPGVAWIQIDQDAKWPSALELKKKR
ncbi:MAG: HlyD family efflux transporter periplasmic adaptor subunit [Victivallaceae bacterium]|nr:HlyD family efflux transporter periplasmic adaptor subunit [Victivallaceae bacterium]